MPIKYRKEESKIKRKKPVEYKIVYNYMGYKRYEELRLLTADKNEAIEYFLELFSKKKNGSLILESDCRVELRAEVNCYIRESIELSSFKEDVNLYEELEKMEKKLTTSYDTFKYTIKLGLDTGFLSYSRYKVLLETENRSDALEGFLFLFYRKQQTLAVGGEIPDIAMEVSISPYSHGIRCLYLKFVNDETEIINKLETIEKDVINEFIS